jgi:N-acetylglucosaminyl-diphospho-decaprenol L-rhamnosyltransferase
MSINILGKMMKVVFSVISHNQANLVKNLIISSENNLKHPKKNFQFRLIKNIPEDLKLDITNLNVRITENLFPKGFGHNHNNVFSNDEPDYFFVVNPDIVFSTKFSIDNFINDMIKNKLDIASPKIYLNTGKLENNHRADITPISLLRKIFGFKENSEKKWLAGMFLVFNGKVFKELKGFDENFYMYVEDCDICMRATNQKYNIGILNNYSVIHFPQRKSNKNFKHFIWHLKSIIYYWIKSFINKSKELKLND